MKLHAHVKHEIVAQMIWLHTSHSNVDHDIIKISTQIRGKIQLNQFGARKQPFLFSSPFFFNLPRNFLKNIHFQSIQHLNMSLF